MQAAAAWRALCAHCTEVDSRVTGLGVSDVQGNMQALFIEVNCESAFFLFTVGEYGHQKHGTFPGILFVPPEVIIITITASAVESGDGSL